ncbi:MAG: porin [Burkholderiales bacterium]|nr:porin [Burkholderiales bacterium]
MKKSLIALAVLAASGAAMAQSSVTLYGLVDADVGRFKTNVAVGKTIQNMSQSRVESDGLNGSRWGMRMREDLGGGMAAVANLESGFKTDTGTSAQGGLLFGRRANVGLVSGFGTVTLGRNSSSYTDVASDHAMMGGASIFDPSNTNNGNSATVAVSALGGNVADAAKFLGRNTSWIGFSERIDNSVKYVSPNFNGFSVGVLYGFGENKTASNDASKTVSASLKYANGPLLVSGGYQSEGSLLTATGAKPVLENAILSVAYDFGVAKVGAGFNRAKYKDITVGSVTRDIAAQNEWNLSVAVPLGATTLSAGYAQSKGDDLGKSSGFGIQALYSLSKRTTLYAGGVSTKAYDKAVAAFLAASPTSSIGRTTTYAAGIRHTF